MDIEGFKTHLAARGRSKTTIDAYAGDLVRAGAFDGMTSDDVDAILAEMRERGLSGAMRKRTLAALRAYFVWQTRDGGMDPTARIEVRAPERFVPEYLTAEESDRLMRVVGESSRDYAVRDAAAIGLMLRRGLRISEALNIDVDDVLEEDGRMSVFVTEKGGKRSRKVLPAEAADLLARYLAGRRADAAPPSNVVPIFGARPAQAPASKPSQEITGPLFLARGGKRLSRRELHARVVMWCARAGIRKVVSPHTLRHSFATALLRKTGGNIRLVQEAMGHANIGTTERYTHVVGSDLEAALGVARG